MIRPYTDDYAFEYFCDLLIQKVAGATDVMTLATQTIDTLEPYKSYSLNHKRACIQELEFRLNRYDFISEFLEMEKVQEIMINGTNNMFVDYGYKKEAIRLKISANRLKALIQKISSGINRSVNTKTPIIDARLEDGSRVNIVLDPIALNGPIVTIRRFIKQMNCLESLRQQGAMDKRTQEALIEAVKKKKNLFISGGTSSGKTTLLNALCQHLEPEERIITIEDSAELDFSQVSNLVRLETRPCTEGDTLPIDMKILIKSALRMRPDRIVVGEIRGSEAQDMLQAMNTGHQGSLSTGHANSAKDMIQRILVMAMHSENSSEKAILNQIGSGIDWIIHLEKDALGKRFIHHIIELEACSKNGIKTSLIMSESRGWVYGD